MPTVSPELRAGGRNNDLRAAVTEFSILADADSQARKLSTIWTRVNSHLSRLADISHPEPAFGRRISAIYRTPMQPVWLFHPILERVGREARLGHFCCNHRGRSFAQKMDSGRQVIENIPKNSLNSAALKCRKNKSILFEC